MRMFFLTGAIVVSASACVPAPEPSTPYHLSKSQLASVESTVRAAMKDPWSARFGRIAAADRPGGAVTVCGMVNGKNSFGAYTGEMPFFGILGSDGRFILADISNDSNAYETALVCRNRGVAL